MPWGCNLFQRRIAFLQSARKTLGYYKLMSTRIAVAGLAVIASLTAFVVGWEGQEFVPYRDIGGVWTVCAGVTGRHVIPGKLYTQRECRALTNGAIRTHGEALLQCLHYPITQPQFEALTSWAYNVGTTAACKSTLVKKINANYPAENWCPELMRWNRVKGKVIRGLTNRRKAELTQCLSLNT